MKVELTINGQPYSLDNASNNEGLIDRNTETEEISGESILSTEEAGKKTQNEEVVKEAINPFVRKEDGEKAWNKAAKPIINPFVPESIIPEGATDEEIENLGYTLAYENIIREVKKPNNETNDQSQPTMGKTDHIPVDATGYCNYQRPPVQENTAETLPNLLQSEQLAKHSSETSVSPEKMPEILQKEFISISPEAEKSDKSTYNDMCEFIQLYKLRWLSGGFWIYDKNFYCHLSPHELKILIGNYTKRKYGYIVKKFQADFPVLMEAEDVDIKDPPRSDLIAFRNVILDTNLRQIPPHPNLIILHRINAIFDSNIVGRCPTWNAFIDFQTGGNPVLKKRFFQAFALLLCNANAKKFVVFYGIGDSGKSVVIRFLCELFPNDTFPINVNQFSEKFVLECTSGKKFGICADLPAKPLNKAAVGIIKEITGGDKVNAQAKFGTPHELITEGGFRAVFASNHPLVLSENDDAFWNRLVYIAFTKAVPKDQQDPHLLDKLLNEKDAFASTVMQELPGLIINNFSLVGEEETKEAITLYQKFANRSVNDIACDFFESALVIDQDCFTKTEDIRQAFSNICDVCVDASAFGKLLRAYLLDFPQVQEARLPNSQGKARGYKGIKLVQPVDLNRL